MALRSDVKNLLKEIKKPKNSVLPSNSDVIGHYYLKKELIDTDIKLSKKNPGLRNAKDKLGSD